MGEFPYKDVCLALDKCCRHLMKSFQGFDCTLEL